MVNSLIPLDDISSFFGRGPEVRLLRLDTIHPEISGNKWFKLRFYLEEALATGRPLLTFGGPWSNHLLATAAACHAARIPCTAIIRGERPAHPSPVLLRAEALGVDLRFTERSVYAAIAQLPVDPLFRGGESPESPPIKQVPDAVKRLLDEDRFVRVPAGGYGPTGAAGAATILEGLDGDHTHLVAAVGTGTMLAGLINASSPGQQVTGIPVLKTGEALTRAMGSLLTGAHARWELAGGYHFGGYAKHTPELIGFMNRFHEQTGIPLDFVYTAKMMYALRDLVRHNRFPAGARILAIHSGGLAGNAGLPKGSLIW